MNFLFKPYNLLKNRVFVLQFCFLGPIIMFFYIVILQPDGLKLFDTLEVTKIAALFSIPAIFIWASHLYLIKRVLIKRLTILNTIVLILWVNVVIGFYNYMLVEVYIFKNRFDHPDSFDWYWFKPILWKSVIFGIVVFVILAISYAGFLFRRKKLQHQD